jgi:glycosyltransferase involved in cell wall biosynthesis
MSAAAAIRVLNPQVDRHLLLLLTGSTTSVANEQAAHLRQGMRARGWRVTTLGLGFPEGVSRQEVEDITAGAGTIGPGAFLHLRSLVIRQQPHVVHAHGSQASLLARLVRLTRTLPVLVSTVDTEPMAGRRGCWSSLSTAHRLTIQYSDLTTTSCAAAARNLAASGGPLRVMPRGVDVDRFQPNPVVRTRTRIELGLENRFVWLAAAPLDRDGGHATILEGFARVAACLPRHVLLIAGDGPLRDELKARAVTLGIGRRVHFVGRFPVSQLMCAADMFLAASQGDDVSPMLLEAVASGLPAIAAKTVANAEVVRDGFTGLLTEPGSGHALAENMERMASRPDAERKWMGLAGRNDVVSRFSNEVILAEWERIYESLLERRQR